MSTETQGISEERLKNITSRGRVGLYDPIDAAALLCEVRRLQQQVRDLQTAARMWEENYRNLDDHITGCLV